MERNSELPKCVSTTENSPKNTNEFNSLNKQNKGQKQAERAGSSSQI